MTELIEPEAYGPGLLMQHSSMLAGSGILPDVAAERGYISIQRTEELARLGFSVAQQSIPGLLVPVHTAFEATTYQYRPDAPRLSAQGKTIKYETLAASRMALDVPKRARQWLGDPHRPLFVTEGARKADSAVSHGLCCVALLGVWNFRGTNEQVGKTALADWEAIALNDRSVYIVFDSDVMTKPAVAMALARLKAFLEAHHAKVLVIYLPPGDGGSKVGLDDYLAAGHAVPELLALASTELRAVTGSDKPPSQATRLVDLLTSVDAELFHTPSREAYATFSTDGHRETWPVRSKSFRQWLAGLHYYETKTAPATQAIQDALNVIEAKALYDGPEYTVHVRLARHEGAIWLDLADKQWRAVKVTPGKWTVVDQVPVKFRRTRGELDLPVPQAGGSLDELWQLVNVRPGADQILLAAFLVAALRPEGPFPVLALAAEQGAAKSTLARILRSLTDPNTAPLRAEPRNAHELMLTASNSWLLVLDNLSHLASWLSDALCRLSTGGGFAARELYSDADEMLFDAQRPAVLTSIEDVTVRGDLLDRAIVLTLPPIPEARRRPERELWADFEAAHPRILGALLTAVAVALAELPHTKLDVLPRMADFAMWATAAEPGLGLARGDFMRAYAGNIAEAGSVALEADALAGKLQDFMNNHPADQWSGTATELLTGLNRLFGESEHRPEGWPKRADKLSGRLKRLAPNLRKHGLDITNNKTDGKRRIILRKVAQNSDPSDPDSAYDHEHRGATSIDRDATASSRDASLNNRDANSDTRDAIDASSHLLSDSLPANDVMIDLTADAVSSSDKDEEPAAIIRRVFERRKQQRELVTAIFENDAD